MLRCASFALALSLLVCITTNSSQAEDKPATARDASEVTPTGKNIVTLIAQDSLAGWQTGDPKSWAVKGGKLIAGEKPSRLYSDFIFTDAELRLRWVGALDPELGSFLDLEMGKTLHQIRVHLRANPAASKPHELVIYKRGEEIVAELDGKKHPLAKVNLSVLPTLLAIDAEAGTTIEAVTFSEPVGALIFNGKDMTGWEKPAKAGGWSVEDGLLKNNGKTGTSYLRSERDYENYVLAFDYKMSKKGNAGVGIRTPRKGWPSKDGMELQMLDSTGKGKGDQMSIYQIFPPIDRAAKSEEWNRVVIRAHGPMISAWENGVLVQHRNINASRKLSASPAKGWIGFQDHGAKTDFKNITVYELPPGPGPAAWKIEPVDPPEVKKPEVKKPDPKKPEPKKPDAPKTPADRQPAKQPEAKKPTEQKPVEQKPADKKPADQQPAEKQPASK